MDTPMENLEFIDTSDAEEQAELERQRRVKDHISGEGLPKPSNDSYSSDDDLDLFRIPGTPRRIRPIHQRSVSPDKVSQPLQCERIAASVAEFNIPSSQTETATDGNNNSPLQWASPSSFDSNFDEEKPSCQENETLDMVSLQNTSVPDSNDPNINRIQNRLAPMNLTRSDLSETMVPINIAPSSPLSASFSPSSLQEGMVAGDDRDHSERDIPTPATSIPPSPTPSFNTHSLPRFKTLLISDEGSIENESRNVGSTMLEHETALEQSPPGNERYGLRKRTNMQINPYTVEGHRYKRSLKNDPAAIVKFNFPERKKKASDQVDMESQEWVMQEQEQTQNLYNESVRSPIATDVPQALRNRFPFDLDSDDQDKSINALDRKLRRAAGRDRLKERKRRKQYLQPFPLDQENQPVASTSKAGMEATPKFGRRNSTHAQIPSDEEGSDNHASPIARSPALSESTQPISLAFLRHSTQRRSFSCSPSHWIDNQDLHQSFCYEEWDPPDTRLSYASQSTKTSNQHSEGDPEEREEEEEEEEEEEKGDGLPILSPSHDNPLRNKKKGMKILKQMLPHFILTKLLNDGDPPASTQKHPRPVALSPPSSPYDSEPELVPGKSKSRIAPSTAPIIVDSESDDVDNLPVVVGPPAPVIDLEEDYDNDDIPIIDVDAWVKAPRRELNNHPSPLIGTRSAREPDLIDRMLARATREISRTRSRDTHFRPSRVKRKRRRAEWSDNSLQESGMHDSHRYPPARHINVVTILSPTVKRRKKTTSKSDGMQQLPLVKPHRATMAKPARGSRESGMSWEDCNFRHVDEPVADLEHFRPLERRSTVQTLLTDVWPSDSCRQEYVPIGKGLNDEHPLSSTLRADCGISALPENLTFVQESYLGSGRLHELKLLVETPPQVQEAPVFIGFGLSLAASSDIEEVMEVLPLMSDKFYEWVMGVNDNLEISLTKRLVEFVGIYYTKFGLESPPEHIQRFTESLLRELGHLTARFQSSFVADGEDAVWTGREFEFLWTISELEIRSIAVNREANLHETLSKALVAFQNTVTTLIHLLLKYGTDKAYSAARQKQPLGCPDSAAGQSLQAWVYLLHMLPVVHSLQRDPEGIGVEVIWREVERIPGHSASPYDPDKSEKIWRTIFTLCAFSRISVHGVLAVSAGLTSSWRTVNEALKLVNLIASEEDDKTKSAVVLRKRDQYIRLVTSRCFLLCSRWNWSLHNGSKVLFSLNEIFRSRNFSNLYNEDLDFPEFIRLHSIADARQWNKKDTSHTFFMKAIILFGDDALKYKGERYRDSQIQKLLSVVVPVNPPGFNRDSAPWNLDLSKLYNRFTSCFVAVLLCPRSQDLLSDANAKLRRCKSYVNFQESDHSIRKVSIRFLMELTILYRHFSLPLDEPFLWSEEMSKILVSDLIRSDSDKERAQVLVCIQMLIAAFGVALRTPSLSGVLPQLISTYPEKRFLDPVVAYIEKVPKQTQANDWQTSEQVKKVVGSFLELRNSVIPKKPVNSSFDQESQESQDEFGSWDLNMDDPALLQALGVEDLSVDNKKILDQGLAQLMDKTLVPYFYIRVCKQVEEDLEKLSSNPDRLFKFDFQWIDCWVKCAQVVVANKIKGWESFVYLGNSSWMRIADSNWRRRVGMRFLYRALQEDPQSFKDLQDRYLAMFFQCLVTPEAEASFEWEYVSLIMNVDHSENPLLSEVFNKRSNSYVEEDLINSRLGMIRDICSSLSMLSCNQMTEKTRIAIGQAVQYFSSLLMTVEEHLQINRNHTSNYFEFIVAVIRSLTGVSVLTDNSSFRSHLTRIRTCIPIEFFE